MNRRKLLVVGVCIAGGLILLPILIWLIAAVGFFFGGEGDRSQLLTQTEMQYISDHMPQKLPELMAMIEKDSSTEFIRHIERNTSRSPNGRLRLLVEEHAAFRTHKGKVAASSINPESVQVHFGFEVAHDVPRGKLVGAGGADAWEFFIGPDNQIVAWRSEWDHE